MDKFLLDSVSDRMPKVNRVIADGLATTQLKGVLYEMDRIFRSLDFPEEIQYVDCNRVSPKVKFETLTQPRDGKTTFELAKSDFFLAAFNFTFMGDPLYPKYLLLPYADTAGLMDIRGKTFAAHAVMTDKTFSMGTESIFKRFQRARLTFERLQYHFIQDGQRADSYVSWSWIHHEAKKRNSKRNIVGVVCSTLANYLFAEFGVTETFRRYTGANIVVGTTDINENDYPSTDWVICKTIGVKPRSYKEDYYEFTKLRIAVPKHEMTPLVQSMVASFFYIADNFPDRVTVEDIDDVWLWKVILGLIIIEHGTSEGLIVKSVEDHQRSVREYVDTIALDEFREGGFDFKDIYDVFIYIMDELNQLTISTTRQMSSLYGKRFVILRYMLDDLVKEINVKIMYTLRSTKNKKGVLELRDVNKIFGNLKIGTIAALSNHAKHPEITTVSSSCDNYLIGITNEIVTQDKASGAGSNQRINLSDPSKHLDASIAEVASYNVLPKSDPTGRNRISPFVTLNERYEIIRDKKHVELIDRTQRMITSISKKE